MIILEGADSAGKSTLAYRIAQTFGLLIKPSSGPPSTSNEWRSRMAKYEQLQRDTVCDRHPCISDIVYSKAFGRDSWLTTHDLATFHKADHLIIYCRSPHAGVLTPQVTAFDTPEYIERLTANLQLVDEGYKNYFEIHPPHLKYDWSNTDVVLALCKEYLQEDGVPFSHVET